ncbi:MAG: nuclear transport factor 2 family protein [Bacteroidota bacterium]
MKMQALTMIFGAWLGVAGISNTDNVEERAVKSIVTEFIAAGDAQDVERLEAVLHDQYRVIWNNPEKGVSPIDRATYLDLIGKKAIGGDKREVKFEEVTMIQSVNATVRAISEGEKATFYHDFHLVKVGSDWKLVNDLFYMIPKG